MVVPAWLDVARWQTMAKTNHKASKRRSKKTASKAVKRGSQPRRKPRPDVVERLRPEESAAVLQQLLDTDPSLRPQVIELATALVTAVDAERIAEEIEHRLVEFDTTDIGDRVGRRPGGYVGSTEAAWEVLWEVVQPFIDNAVRLAELGHVESACDALRGVMVGLYAVRECRGELLAWVPDFPAETGAHVLFEVKRALGRRPGKVAMLRQVVSGLPEWSDWAV